MKEKPFEKLSKRAKRKKIAGDALLQLNNSAIEVSVGFGYITVTDEITHRYDNEELDLVLKENKNVCKVCIMGGLLVGDVMNRDNLGLIDADMFDGVDIIDRLSDYFPEDNLRLSETAFEGVVIESMTGEEPTEEQRAAIKFGKRFTNDKNRFKAILNNIINSKDGIFHP
jgi:hypothetical protein